MAHRDRPDRDPNGRDPHGNPKRFTWATLFFWLTLAIAAGFVLAAVFGAF